MRLALLSNVLLLLLLIRFAKNIDITDVFQRYLFVMCCVLIVLLSFMTGNVGLILREKTILLPFLFLLLFATKRKNADRIPANRSNLSDQSRVTLSIDGRPRLASHAPMR